MPNLGAPEIIIIALVILLLFGFKKLPDAARSLGRSARVFKSEMNEMKAEDAERARAKEVTSTTVEGETASPRAATNGTNATSPIVENRPNTDNQSGPIA